MQFHSIELFCMMPYSGSVQLRLLMKDLRKELGFSQEDLARALGVTLSTIGKYESKMPLSPKFLARLVRFCRERELTKFEVLFRAGLLTVETSDPANALGLVLNQVHGAKMQITIALNKLAANALDSVSLVEQNLPAAVRLLTGAEERLISFGALGGLGEELDKDAGIQAKEWYLGSPVGPATDGPPATTPNHEERVPDEERGAGRRGANPRRTRAPKSPTA
jgi:transcriptional regulator with XRE-family HTH domain